MDHPIPYVPVSITILLVSVAVVFTVWVPVIMYRAAIRHGRSTSASLRLAGALMVVFAVWFGLSAGYTQVEAFHDGLDRPVCPIRGAHPSTTPATCPVPTHPTSPVASVAVGHGSS